jgi:isopentenyldiphosphate isomerase
MDKYIEFSFEGVLTSDTVSRETAITEGHSYGISYVLLTSGDSLLLQLRSSEKESQPGLWDISSGGHVELRDAEVVTDIDEIFKKAAVRELKEELGISVKAESIELLIQFHEDRTAVNGTPYRKHHQVYTYEVDKNKLKYKLNKKEVEDVKWMTKEEVVDLPGEKITNELGQIQKLYKDDS